MASHDRAVGIGRSRVDLVQCLTCGFVWNESFDESALFYDLTYEDSQTFSGRFVEYARWLASKWIRDWGLAGQTVIEIGAGRGDFSKTLVNEGVGRVVAIDPTINLARVGDGGDRIEWVQTAFDAASVLPPCRGVVLRHVLEHVEAPGTLLSDLRRALWQMPQTPVLLEIPDARRILAAGAFWDVYFEHCSYFDRIPLVRLFERHGFVVDSVSAAFGNQYLLVAARVDRTNSPPGPARPPADLLTLGAGFAETAAASLAQWVCTVEARRTAAAPVVVWGAGSKGTAFLTALGEHASAVTQVIDVNPYLHGRFISGTGHLIESPAALRCGAGGLVVAMNENYLQEIAAAVHLSAPEADVRALS